NDDGGGGIFCTLDTPNTGIDALKLPGYCNAQPLLPCTTATNASNRYAIRMSARSRHGGGVNTAMADGPVRFMSDGVSLSAWQALSTMNGGEPIDSSAD